MMTSRKWLAGLVGLAFVFGLAASPLYSSIRLQGSTSGTLTLLSAAVTGSASWRFPGTSTNLAATGGTSHYLAQTSVGGAITSKQVALSEITGAGTAAAANLGTAGATVPQNNTANTFSAPIAFTNVVTYSGTLIVPLRPITAAGSVTVSATTDYFLCINKTVGAATTVNLPASPATGQTYLIKDCKGDAATNNITITPNSGTIDGAATYVISANRGSAGVTYAGASAGWAVN